MSLTFAAIIEISDVSKTILQHDDLTFVISLYVLWLQAGGQMVVQMRKLQSRFAWGAQIRKTTIISI